jgi:hypothetical protein
MKKRRYKFIDPQRARLATGGGITLHPYTVQGKRCAVCEQERYSVDATGICGPCRVGKYDQKKPGVPNA